MVVTANRAIQPHAGIGGNAVGSFGSRKLLLFILVLSFAIRLGWMLTQTSAIENEGADYARLAQNLLQGKGYVNLQGGPETLFPPLFPLLMAAGSLATRDTETAGRLVSVISGALLVLPLFHIALRIFGRRVAFCVAWLTALHPLLVALSASVYVESLYLTILFAGLYWGLRALDLENWKHAMACGFFFGLAYLTRPEGLAYTILVALFLGARAVRVHNGFVIALRYIGILALSSIVLLAPYAAYLSTRSHHLRLEGKMAINQVINLRMGHGMSYPEAAYGLGPHLEPDGPYLKSDQFSVVAPRESRGIRLALVYFLRGINHRGANVVLGVAAERSFGRPLICLLVLLSFFGISREERKQVRWQEGFMLAAVVLTFIILLSLQFVWGRYLFPFLPFLILWGASGLVLTSRWLQRFSFVSRVSAAGLVLEVLLFAGIVVPAAASLSKESELIETKDTYVRTAGNWLNQYRPGDKNLMTVSGTVPYYADGTESYLPYTDSSRALQYIHREHPDFIILRGDEMHARPYAEEWFSRAVPDPCARLVWQNNAPIPQQVKIYEWTCAD